MKRRALIIWLVTGIAVSVWLPGLRAQEPGGDKGTSVSAVERKNRAPVNKEILRVRLPEPKETKLANGLTVLVLERHELPTVTLTLWVETGALADPKDLPGLATFTAEMLREGTARRSSAQLAAETDDIGATLNTSAEFGSSVSTVSASGLVDNLDKLLDLMSDVVLNPTFPADELEKFKTRQLAELEQQRSTPEFLSQEKFFQVLYRDFPAAVISPTPDSVKQVTVAELKRFHEQYYAPNNAILGVAGDVTLDQLKPQLEKYFGEWKNRPVTQPDLRVLPPPAAKKIYLVDRPKSVQTNIVAGDYALRRSDPDYIPLFVMNRILGGGPTGRLFLNLREEKGYTYGAYSYFTADIYRGPWIASTEVRNAVTDGSMHELMAEFKRMRSEQVPENELDDARRSIVASFALSLEQPATLLRYAMTVKYYNLPEDYYNRYPEEVAKVTPDVVQRMAQKYVDLDHLQVVCVGDGSQIKTVLEKYGPVEVYDTEGKPVTEKAAAAGKSGR
ncbi:MAG: insulinase family protein [Acidobacteriia bacterium]|nr:insulinase family protein [Terriglobia bacterium]